MSHLAISQKLLTCSHPSPSVARYSYRVRDPLSDATVQRGAGQTSVLPQVVLLIAAEYCPQIQLAWHTRVVDLPPIPHVSNRDKAKNIDSRRHRAAQQQLLVCLGTPRLALPGRFSQGPVVISPLVLLGADYECGSTCCEHLPCD